MTALLSLLGPNSVLYALGAAALAVLLAFMKGRLSGAKAERNKQAEAELKARDIADRVDNDVGALPGSKARDELKQWSHKP